MFNDKILFLSQLQSSLAFFGTETMKVSWWNWYKELPTFCFSENKYFEWEQIVSIYANQEERKKESKKERKTEYWIVFRVIKAIFINESAFEKKLPKKSHL